MNINSISILLIQSGALMRFAAARYFSVIFLLGILALGLACTKATDDSQLTSQIQSRLNQDSGLHDKQITVQTSGGVVTLSGTVENETQREAAARYASATPGIKEVVNNLETASAAATRAPSQMDQMARTPKPPPAPARRWAEPFSDKRRPSMPRHRHRAEPDSTEMAAAAPPPAETYNRAADENPAPAPAAQAAPAPQPPPPPPPRKVTV